MEVKEINFAKVSFAGFLSNAPQERCFVMVGDACEYAEKCLKTRVKELQDRKDLPRNIIHDTGMYSTGAGWFRTVVLGCKNYHSIETLSYQVLYKNLFLHYR